MPLCRRLGRPMRSSTITCRFSADRLPAASLADAVNQCLAQPLIGLSSNYDWNSKAREQMPGSTTLGPLCDVALSQFQSPSTTLHARCTSWPTFALVRSEACLCSSIYPFSVELTLWCDVYTGPHFGTTWTRLLHLRWSQRSGRWSLYLASS